MPKPRVLTPVEHFPEALNQAGNAPEHEDDQDDEAVSLTLPPTPPADLTADASPVTEPLTTLPEPTAAAPALIPPGIGRRIEYMSLDHLPKALKNPKKHSLPDLMQSISLFGFTAPPIIDDRTGRLVAGHGRCAALKRMRANGETAPEGVIVDADGLWLVPVLCGWRSLSDDHAEKVLLADNLQSERGGWHEKDLVAMLDSMPDHSGLGVSPESLEAMMERLKGDPPKEAKEKADSEGKGPGGFKLAATCPQCGHQFDARGEA